MPESDDPKSVFEELVKPDKERGVNERMKSINLKSCLLGI